MRIVLIWTLMAIFFVNADAQKTRGEFLKFNFSEMIDSLIKPPANCDEAWKYVEYDSLNGVTVPNQKVTKQGDRISTIEKQIDSLLKKNSIGRRHLPPRGEDIPQSELPPGGQHPEIENSPENIYELFQDMNDMNLSMDKMTVAKEKLKNEISNLEKTVNAKLRATRVGEFDSRIEIMNKFMDTVRISEAVFIRIVKENMPRVDEVLKKYGYGAKLSATPMANDFLKMQASQLAVMKFLFNISRELINLGAKFHLEQLQGLENN